MPETSPRQKCPNCGKVHDVSVYVTGQRLLCKCGIRFEVTRPDGRQATSRVVDSPAKAAPARNEASTRVVRDEMAKTVVARALQIPGYELVELVGRGGMGEVWKARQVSLGREVAIKVLAPDLAQDEDFVRRFEKESTALAALSHPGIVQVIERGFCDSSHTWFFVMEFCEGASLRELMEGKKLPAPDVLRLVAQVARAIDYAHGRGVIHRDLKPENVLVDREGNAKVVDFGLAGLRRGSDQLNVTREAMAMGTLHYMAPEQRRDARGVDERADIYSLGVILYEALAGEVPLGRFRLPSERVEGLDSRIDKVVAKALDAEPDARYPSAGAMALEIEAIAAAGRKPGSVDVSKAAEAGHPLQRPPIPGRRRIAAGAVGGALLVVMLALGLCSRNESVERVAPADTNGTLAVRLERLGGGFNLRFEDGAATLAAESGEWTVADGELRARVPGGEGREDFKPFATLEGVELPGDDLALEAVVRVEAAPASESERQSVPGVELSWRGSNGEKVALAALYGKDARYRLATRSTAGEGSAATEPGSLPAASGQQPLVLRLKVTAGVVRAEAGPHGALPIRLERTVGRFSSRGKLTLACLDAHCRFSEVRGAFGAGPEPRPTAP